MPEQPVLVPVPPPWKHVQTWAVGGLFQVGYADNTDLLLVLSGQGRGVFDCTTGAKLDRDHEEDHAHDFFDPVRLIASGFGRLEGQEIRMAGLYGGGLTHTTADGWFLEDQAPAWPKHTIYLEAPDAQDAVPIADDGACELRAYGFSQTGRSFVVATSCDVKIYARDLRDLPSVS